MKINWEFLIHDAVWRFEQGADYRDLRTMYPKFFYGKR